MTGYNTVTSPRAPNPNASALKRHNPIKSYDIHKKKLYLRKKGVNKEQRVDEEEGESDMSSEFFDTPAKGSSKGNNRLGSSRMTRKGMVPNVPPDENFQDRYEYVNKLLTDSEFHRIKREIGNAFNTILK